jgi:hypothetical protein
MKDFLKMNKFNIILFIVTTTLYILFVSISALADPPPTWYSLQPSWLHTSEQQLTVLQEISETLTTIQTNQEEAAYVKIAGIMWLVALSGFSIAISIMTIFAIAWRRN